MGVLDGFIHKLKQGETPFFRTLGRIARWFLRPTAPRVPDAVRPLGRLVYGAHYSAIDLFRAVINLFYSNPLFQSRCKTVGRNLSIGNLPYVQGLVEIEIGDNVLLGGNVMILSPNRLPAPKLVLRDHSELNWNVQINVSREVIIEEYVRVSYDCRISDSDGHPRQADLRAHDLPPSPRDIRPVRLCRYAWIGNGTHILKGVTIGEGAVVGANSVVISDIPPYSLAMGNPAEVILPNYGKPSKPKKENAAPPA